MSAILDKLTVTGFKSIREMNVELSRLNILIGGNGAGKTNFISLFKLLSAIVDSKLQEFVARGGGAGKFLYNGPKVTEFITIDLEFGENLYKATLHPNESDELFFSEEIVYVWDRLRYPRPYNKSLGAGQREGRVATSDERIARYVRSSISNWHIYHFHDTSETARLKQPSDVNDNRALASDARNLASFLLLLREGFPKVYKQIVDVVRLAAPFFDDFVLRPMPLQADKIRLEWTQKGSDVLLGPNDFSDGTLRFICLAVALLQPTPPSTILIDEPELGLHPYAITLLASLLRGAATRMQIVASTQSVPLVNQFTPSDLLIVDRLNGSSTFRKLDSKQFDIWLDDYGMGDLWEKNVLGGRPSYA
jgi:predicted ATPase